MATKYILMPGYAWGNDNETDSEEMLEVARTITKEELRAKCLEYDWEKKLLDENECGEEYLDSFLSRYNELPTADGTFNVYPEDDENPGGYIYQGASGSGIDRYIKEVVRRAHCWLLVDKLFRRGRSVSMRIA
jgi:hypothetical protein